MFTQTEFAEFVRTFRDTPMLTVYISGVYHDPSERATWRVQVDHALAAAREGVAAASHDERRRFERCVQSLNSALAASPTVHTAPGWVAFITVDTVERVEPLPINVPTIAVWGAGPYVTPYVCALSEDQSGVVAVVDARQAALYEYRHGVVTRQHIVHAQSHLHPPLHMGDIPRQGFHPGVRGATGREVSQRARETGTHRMLRETADYMLRHAGAEGWLLIGGIPEVGSQLAQHLPQSVLDRVVQLDALDVHGSEAVILGVVRRGLAAVRNAATARQAASLADTEGYKGRAAAGLGAIHQALAQSRVRELYVTDGYLGSHPEEGEAALRLALGQQARVHVISGVAERTLDDVGGAVARLYYNITNAEYAAPSQSVPPSTLPAA